MKYLGVLIDCILEAGNIISVEHIAVKMSRSVGIITKPRHFVQSINPYCCPIIYYGLTAWGLASKSYVTKILNQKRAVRADILPLNFLYYKSVCCLMHDIRNRKVPSNILNLFSGTTSIHSYNTRSSSSNIWARYPKESFFKSGSQNLE